MVGRLALQDGQAGAVVREFGQVGECNLPSDDRIVPGDVGLRASQSVLELDVQPLAELLEVVCPRPDRGLPGLVLSSDKPEVVWR